MKDKRVPNNRKIVVLISSAGKQVSLVEQFQSINRPSKCRVIVCDRDSLAAAATVADRSFISPAIDSAEYDQWMLSLCSSERVDLLLTLLPEELIRLESLRDDLGKCGTLLLGMPLSSINDCIDKRRHSTFCSDSGMKVPPYWKADEYRSIPESAYPVIAKQFAGKGSRGQSRLVDQIDAERFVRDLVSVGHVDQYILQKEIVGDEYGLDIFNGLDGSFITAFIRKKHRMRNGETDIAETVNDEQLSAAAHALSGQLRHQGIVDCDVIRCPDGDYLLDLNPRFGGGYIFSQRAGANVPAALLSLFLGLPLNKAWISPRTGITSARVSSVEELSPEKKRIGIITTGGPRIGMGHAMRQLTFAEYASSAGCDVIIYTDNRSVADHAGTTGIQHRLVDIFSQQKLRYLLDQDDLSLLMIDVHERDFPEFRWVEKLLPTSLVVSRVGHGFSFFGNDVFLIGEDLGYWECVRTIRNISEDSGREIRITSGRAYMVFRSEFEEIVPKDASERENAVLIFHGGSDPHHLTERTIRAIQNTKETYKVKILVGPAFSDVDRIRLLAEDSKHRTEIIKDTADVARIMAESAVAVINGGNVRYELCRTETPYVAIAFQAAQYACTQQLSELGVGINLGVAEEVTDQEICDAVDDLVMDKEKRRRMQKKMQTLFDGDGVKRLFGLIVNQSSTIRTWETHHYEP